MKKIISIFIALLLVTISIPGCTSITSTPATTSTTSLSPSDSDLLEGMGRLVINITDPPAPLENVEVSFDNLEIHKAGGPWAIIPMENDTFELLNLEGVTEVLADYTVEAGVYTQIRLDVIAVQIWVSGDETPHKARVPSGKIKLVGSFEVIEGEQTEVTVDINGAKSVQIGNDNEEYIFRPVVKLLIPESAKPDDEENGETIETQTVEPTETVPAA